jgi:hypothetical protein
MLEPMQVQEEMQMFLPWSQLDFLVGVVFMSCEAMCVLLLF